MNKSKHKMKAALPSMPSILDRELRERDRDAFGHQSYADALRDLVESPLNIPPFSIGLLGPWGTGKSTIKELTNAIWKATKPVKLATEGQIDFTS
jgi:hypothetical protein